jgi:hypothetical protein
VAPFKGSQERIDNGPTAAAPAALFEGGPMRFALSRSLLAALILGTSLSAQSLSVSTPVLQHDTSTTITLTDPSRANQQVTVTLTSGNANKPETQEVTIKLNALGVGSVKWWVPRWDSVWICAPGVPGITVAIL